MGVIGVTANVKKGETDCNIVKRNSLPSILSWALDSGKSAGIVTNTRITHATPAGGYANVAHRNWEGYIGSEKANISADKCKDIGRQLVENYPGNKLSVILGGGNRYLYPNTVTDPVSGKPGERRDGKNIVENWLKSKKNQGLRDDQYQFVDNFDKLNSVNYSNVDYLFGIFNHDHISYDKERDPKQEPSLEDMTDAAIRVLSKNLEGFVLLVEGGRIDHSHHDNYGNMALYETVAFDRAIERAVWSVSKEETLVVVTADHSHTFTMNGYPQRGHNIMGIADREGQTNKSFTSLLYANGPGHHENRTDPSTEDTCMLELGVS